MADPVLILQWLENEQMWVNAKSEGTKLSKVYYTAANTMAGIGQSIYICDTILIRIRK